MAKHVLVPINKDGWGNLSALGITHEIVGETVKLRDDKYSFAGGHRVRLFHFKKNVHWRISSAEFDITDVKPATPPRKTQRV